MAPLTPNAIKAFVDRVAKLPGIGPRQATRLAFYLVGQGKDAAKKALAPLERRAAHQVIPRVMATKPRNIVRAIATPPFLPAGPGPSL